MAISIRTLTEADLEAAGDIINAAYESDYDRTDRLRRYLSLQPDGWLIALLDGRPVGVGGAVNYGPFASIGSVGVHPTAQRRGVARALMERLLAWLERENCPMAVLVATEAGAPLYRGLGFVDDGQTLVYAREHDEHEHEGERRRPRPTTRVSAAEPEDLPALVAFDAPIFGARRRRILSAYATDAPERMLVARDGAGRISGYLYAQPTMLGPWAARTAEDAEALLAQALSLPFEGSPRAIVPATNERAAHLLARHGFAAPHALRHMRRGGSAPPGQPTNLYGLASFATG